MSVNPNDFPAGAESVDTFLAHALRSEAGACPSPEGWAADLFQPDRQRLDDRTRLAALQALRTLVDGIEDELLGEASEHVAYDALLSAGLLRDADLIGELVCDVLTRQIAQALDPRATDDVSGLLERWSRGVELEIASAAHELLRAEASEGVHVSAAVFERLVWRVAAALGLDDASSVIAAHPESTGPLATAARLATALAVRGEGPAVLPDVLADRRLNLFFALVAHGAGVSPHQVRSWTVDPGDDRLWLALRAGDTPRSVIARVGYLLSEADPRRDLEAFADRIDTIAAIPAERAREALRCASLPTEFVQAKARLK